MSLHTLALSALLAAPLAAQVTETSPKGYLKTEGNYIFPLGQYTFFSQAQTIEYAQLDDTLKGASRKIVNLYLRRDGSAPDDKGLGATKVKLYLRIAHGDSSKILPFTNHKLDDLVVGSWTTIHSGTTVDFPDLTTKPTTPPAPFSVKLPFNSAFAYDGKSGLYVQILVVGNTGLAPFFPFDGEDYTAADSFARTETSGKSCLYQNAPLELEAGFIIDRDTQMIPATFMMNVFPPTTTAQNGMVALIGATDPNAAIPFCTNLHSSAEWVDVFFTDVWKIPSGTHGKALFWTFPYDAKLVGIRVWTQAWGLDATATRPTLVGSAGVRTGPLPAVPTKTLDCWLGYLFGPGGGFTTTGSFRKHLGMILGLE